jgi:hypothetical protein
MKSIETIWKGVVKPRGLLLTMLVLAGFIFPASALAADPPSITSGFTPSSIGVGDTSTLSFTISNPANNGTLTGVGFTDTLPTPWSSSRYDT